MKKNVKIIIFVCVASLIVAFYVQFYARIDLGRLIGINKDMVYGNKTEDEKEEMEAEFLSLFNNSIENIEEGYENKKQDESKNLVYTNYEKKETKQNSYDLEVHIPTINVKNEIVDNYNKEIEETFTNMTEKVLKSENRNVIYTVDYTSNIQNGILSEKVRPLSVKTGNNFIAFEKNKKTQKKKKKSKMKGKDEENNNDYSFKNKNKSFSNTNNQLRAIEEKNINIT